MSNPEPLKLDIPEEAWTPIAPEEGPDADPWARILYTAGVTINGTGFHLEGWAVTVEGSLQTAMHGDEDLGNFHLAVGAEGHFETVTVRGREYVLAMSPYC